MTIKKEKSLNVFREVECLTEDTPPIKGIDLIKIWKADNRNIGGYLHKFEDYNIKVFDFLGIKPKISGSDKSISISFATSKFIGAIPLRSPKTGTQIGDFIIIPRYIGRDKYEDYVEILKLLDYEINIETIDSLPLISGRNFRPPMYLEAMKFLSSLEEVIKRTWRKFDRIEKISHIPQGSINWNKYIKAEYKVENRIRFPVGKNILSEFHKEYSQIKYVFDLCKSELLSSNTPLKVKLNIRGQIDYLSEKLYNHFPLKIDFIQTRFSDNPFVKNCKICANKILGSKFIDSTAWRVDFSIVFEKFVQYIFKEVAKECGGHLFSNYKFRREYSQQYFSWGLKHLEPDIIFQKGDKIFFIDAKYKAHLYNKNERSEILKETHRTDLHQLLAYASFSETKQKFGFLCYPSQKIEISEIKYSNSLNQTNSLIKIFGLPLRIGIIPEAKKMLLNEL